MKILIVGFGRSGTTLTFRTFRKNRYVKKAFLETCLVGRYSKENLINKYSAFRDGGPNCVEKVIYNGDRVTKRQFVLDISIYGYCRRWIKYFGDEARIVQIVRHPLDTLSSLIIKRGRRMRVRKKLKDIQIDDIPEKLRERMIDTYFRVVPKYPKMIATLPQTKTFKYEDIILNTKPTLNDMFSFCNLYPGSSEAMRKDRAFNYKRTGFTVDRPIGEIIKVFNSISDGLIYEDI